MLKFYVRDLRLWFSEKEERIWTVVTVLLIILTFYFLGKNLNFADIVIKKAGIFGPVATVVIYAILAPTPISTDPITAVSGVLLGPVLGIVVAWIGNNLGATVEYFIGKKVGRSERFSSVKDKLPFGLNKLPIESPYVLIFGRAIPGYGGKVINLMAGIYEVSFKTFLWTTVLINLVGAILLSFGGYGLLKVIGGR